MPIRAHLEVAQPQKLPTKREKKNHNWSFQQKLQNEIDKSAELSNPHARKNETTMAGLEPTPPKGIDF